VAETLGKFIPAVSPSLNRKEKERGIENPIEALHLSCLISLQLSSNLFFPLIVQKIREVHSIPSTLHDTEPKENSGKSLSSLPFVYYGEAEKQSIKL
jgi:hypothetical protein